MVIGRVAPLRSVSGPCHGGVAVARLGLSMLLLSIRTPVMERARSLVPCGER